MHPSLAANSEKIKSSRLLNPRPSRKIKNYTDDEISIIREHFDPLKSFDSCERISAKYLKDRTPTAILGKASKLGLQRPLRLRKWEKEETELLLNNIDEPISSVYNTLKIYWEKNKMPMMGYASVKRQLVLMGKGTKCQTDGYMTREQMAEGLGCSVFMISSWMRTYSSVIKPEKPIGEKGTMFVPLKGFKRFAKQYPGEIAKCKPNILWLLTILFEPDHY
jgi:hypothetical protein